MLFRSRVLFVLILIPLAVMSATACKKTKPKVEARLSGLRGDSLATAGKGSLAGGSGDWGTGAPDASSFAMDGSSTFAGGAGSNAKDGATGGYTNDGNFGAGIDAGNFISELEMIHFEYDRAEIADAWKVVLDDHATWLSQNPNVMVQIEGHCDERGTDEYNVSLGQNRADIVRTYLIDKGVDGQRLSTLSYGKMRPLSFDQSEEAMALNRRAMFLVYQADGQAAANDTAAAF